MFKLRLYSQVGSVNYSKGIKTVIQSRGSKKKMIEEANHWKNMFHCEVLNSKNEVVFDTENEN